MTYAYETARLPYTLRRSYVPDFVCRRADGTTFYIEVKGYLRPADRAKLLAVAEVVPRPDVRIVFGKDNRLNKRSKTTYSMWAKKHKFPFAVGFIPEEWFHVKPTT